MRYIGGKHRIAKQLAGAILPHVGTRRLIEPFCGGLSATVALQPVLASDASEPLIRLIEAVRRGWEPRFDSVTDEDYAKSRAKSEDECDPQDTFHLLCCSYGGKWKGGLTRGGSSEPNRDFPKQGRNALLRKVRATMDVTFAHGSYSDYSPGPGDVFYCDPPYAGVTNGYATGPFDSETFWDWVKWSGERGALMFVSEFRGPDWAEVHAEFPSRTDLRKRDAGQQATVEKLFRVGEL